MSVRSTADVDAAKLGASIYSSRNTSDPSCPSLIIDHKCRCVCTMWLNQPFVHAWSSFKVLPNRSTIADCSLLSGSLCAVCSSCIAASVHTNSEKDCSILCSDSRAVKACPRRQITETSSAYWGWHGDGQPARWHPDEHSCASATGHHTPFKGVIRPPIEQSPYSLLLRHVMQVMVKSVRPTCDAQHSLKHSKGMWKKNLLN